MNNATPTDPTGFAGVLSRWRAAGLIGPSIATLVASAVLLSLGTWQLERKRWKESLLATIEARAHLAPLDNPGLAGIDCQPDQGLLDPCEYRPVQISGFMTHGQERYVFISVPVQPNGVGGPGYWAFAPLLPDGLGGGMLAVNRGFVPEDRKTAWRAEPRLSKTGNWGEDTVISGMLRHAEPRRAFSGQNDPRKNIFFVRDPNEMWDIDQRRALIDAKRRSEAAVTDPDTLARLGRLAVDYYLDQTAPPPPGLLPMPLAGHLEIPNRHLEYMLTWYGLAAALAGVFIVFARGRLARPPE